MLSEHAQFVRALIEIKTLEGSWNPGAEVFLTLPLKRRSWIGNRKVHARLCREAVEATLDWFDPHVE